jgi:hypothetical protein
MRGRIRFRERVLVRRVQTSIVLFIALVVGCPWLVGSAGAVSIPHPEPPKKLTVQSQLSGSLHKGGEVRFTIVATDPSGWPDLTSVSILLLLHGQPIQAIAFDVRKGTIATTGSAPTEFPSTTELTGSFLEVFQKEDREHPPVLHQTFSITLNVWARIREAVPSSTVVRVLAVNQDGDVSRALVKAKVSGSFLSWGTFAVAAAVALFLGGLIGNTFTHRRYRQRQPSVWDILERRLREQRGRPPARSLVSSEGAGG